MTSPPRRRLLLVGGTGGLLGRHVRAAFANEFAIRSLHRRPFPGESSAEVEVVSADVRARVDWDAALRDVDVVLNVAWYRWAPAQTFALLRGGLVRLVDAARKADVGRFLQVSVPAAPESLESSLPYLFEKRAVDRAVERSGLSYAILRPSLLFAERDVLLTVMLRSIRRYPFFPMFGDGEYRVSPLAARDLAGVLLQQARARANGTYDVGGPETFRFRELTDLMFALAGKPPRYWRMTPANGVRLARILQAFRSRLLYAYEVEWLVSDLLALPPPADPPAPLGRVRPFLEAQLAAH
ncbi:MAG TPA: NAD(P)H-binding protein [Thermoplasmata archaeon]|nr:NAD(P)H-binding protein [Thermoplasmata archaeon]